MAKISVKEIFSSKHLSAGDSVTSDVIDLRTISSKHLLALEVVVAVGTAGTAGTTNIALTGCATESGTFITPSLHSAIGGSFGTGCLSDIVDFSDIPVMPFIKIVATQAGAGTVGKDSYISAKLIAQ